MIWKRFKIFLKKSFRNSTLFANNIWNKMKKDFQLVPIEKNTRFNFLSKIFLNNFSGIGHKIYSFKKSSYSILL